jgi:peptidoglycan/LPS O-acetylase OafA/YrhL
MRRAPRTAREADRQSWAALGLGVFFTVLGTVCVVKSNSAPAYWIAVVVQCGGVVILNLSHLLAQLAGRWERLEEERARLLVEEVRTDG